MWAGSQKDSAQDRRQVQSNVATHGELFGDGQRDLQGMGRGPIAPVPKRGHGLTMTVDRSIRTRYCRDRGKWINVSVEAEATKRTRKSWSSRPRTLSSNGSCKEDTQGTHQRRQDRVHQKRITKSWNGGPRFLVQLMQPEVLRHRRRAAPQREKPACGHSVGVRPAKFHQNACTGRAVWPAHHVALPYAQGSEILCLTLRRSTVQPECTPEP